MGLMANYGIGGFSDAVYFARRGMRITHWVDALIFGAPITVQTNPGIVYNLVAGEDVFVTQMHYSVDTVNDDCHFSLVWTTAINGGGVATQIDVEEIIYTGAAITGHSGRLSEFIPPHLLRYEDGVRCITMQTDANDAACLGHIGWDGWSECCPAVFVLSSPHRQGTVHRCRRA